MKAKTILHKLAKVLPGALLGVAMILPMLVQAAPVALANSPLAASSASSVQPNVMFMLDDSGSMNWDYMPDNAKNFSGKYGFNSSQCNGVYYNPAITYTPPITSTGSSYPNSSFTAAWDDGFNTAAGTSNLSTAFPGGSGTGSSGNNITAGPAFYYVYSGSQTTEAQKNFYNTSSTFYQECNSAIGSSPGNGVFTKVTVSSTSGPGASDERTNFANWYSYYSTRMLMMKTSVGLAFRTMNSSFRIGFMTLNNNVSPDFVDIATFNAAQKAAWYSTLYGANPGQSTPLREALSKIGNLYANKYASTTAYKATITVSGNTSTSVSSIIVSSVGTELMAGTSASNTSSSKVATNIAGQINATNSPNYSATASGSVVTITGTVADLGRTLTITKSGSMSLTATAFSATTTSAQLNGVVPADPMQYSCQKNFAILSTDGFWNGNAGYKLDGAAIGNQDGTAPRPMYDGSTIVKTTTRVQETQTRIAMATSQNQQRTQQLQMRTSNLQQSAGTLQWTTKRQQTVAPLQWQTKLQQTVAPLQWQTKLQQTTAPLRRSTLSSYTSTVYRLQVASSATGPWSDASASTTYSCITSGSASGTTKYCRLGSVQTSGTGLASCSVTYNNPGTTTTNGSKNVITACTPVWSTPTAVGANGTCNASSTVQCSTGTATTNYVATYAGTCTVNFNAAGTNTANASGNVITACPTSTTWSTATNIGASMTCTPSATRQCPAGTGTTTYLTSQAATCTPTWTSASASSTADANGNVIKACPTSASWSTAANVGVAGTCTPSTNIQCPAGTGTSSYLTSSTATCAVTWTSAATPNTPDASGNVITACPINGTFNSVWTNATSCTPGANDQCQYSWGSWSNATSCEDNFSSGTGTWNIASGTKCQYAAWSSWSNTGSCNAAPQSTSAPYVNPATQCQTTDTGFVGVSGCTPSTNATGQAITCNTALTGGTTNYVASCTPGLGSAGNNWVTTTCYNSTVSGPTYVASCTPSSASAGNGYVTTSCTTTTDIAGASSCTTPNSSTYNCSTTPVGSCTGQTATAGNGYTSVSCTNASGGTPDTLADTAMYYYQTDLRDPSLSNCTGAAGVDVCENNVPISGLDTNEKQHLTTFTLGLGARGRMVFSSTYQTDTSGDFYAVKQGSAANGSTVCSWQASGACNWPVPSSNAIENIDDLWHAAVNGRGTYFSATDPASLSVGLSETLKSINQVTGAAAAAATSTLNPVAGNNYAYVASYTTQKWIGNLEERTINVSNGTVSETAVWCVENISPPTCLAPSTIVADTSGSTTSYNCSTPATDVNLDNAVNVLDCSSGATFDVATTSCLEQISNTCVGTMQTLVGLASDTRHVYAASGGSLVEFNPTNFGTDANFAATHINGLSQWGGFTAAQQTAAAGANLVNYLRGQKNHEENRTSNPAVDWLYRYRDATFGDALESRPTFAGAPPFNYNDPGYSAFQSSNASRAKSVFIGANDGMLHAFNAETGVERWAFIPSVVLPNLWHLADTNYSSQHVNFVNGPPIVSDICVANCTNANFAATTTTLDDPVWKTILVGGLNAGGREYYALDITDPVNPALLWEFTSANDNNLGYSYGAPLITKKQDGTWVVVLTSGYDNGSTGPNGVAYATSGDGLGHLYVLDGATGNVIDTYDTTVGSAATPSGLAKFSGYSETSGTNLVGYIYGGDLLGNMWRFDINSPASSSNPFLFATVKDSLGNSQPITVAPELGKINNKRVIYFGTGKYLETADLSNTQRQSFYAIQDDDATTTFINPRTSLVQQTLSLATGYTSLRTSTTNPVDFSTGRGWFVDLPDTGERVNLEAKLISQVLIVASLVPSNTACSPGGYGWLNYFDYATGQAVGPVVTGGTNKVASQKTDGTIVGLNEIYIGGTPIILYVTNRDPTPKKPAVQPVFPVGNNGSFQNKRQMWREIY